MYNMTYMVNDDFIVGFIAGEGHLGVTKNYQWKPYVHPRFSIQLHERDSAVIEAIAERVGAEDRVKYRKDRPHVELSIKKAGQIWAVHDLLNDCDSDVWYASDKYKNFQIWSKIVNIHGPKEKTTSDDERIQIAELAKELNKDAGHNNVDWDEFIHRVKTYES